MKEILLVICFVFVGINAVANSNHYVFQKKFEQNVLSKDIILEIRAGSHLTHLEHKGAPTVKVNQIGVVKEVTASGDEFVKFKLTERQLEELRSKVAILSDVKIKQTDGSTCEVGGTNHLFLIPSHNDSSSKVVYYGHDCSDMHWYPENPEVRSMVFDIMLLLEMY